MPESKLTVLAPLLLVVYGVGVLTAAQRRIFASLASVDIPLLPVARRRPTFRDAVNWPRTGTTWTSVDSDHRRVLAVLRFLSAG
ncbi:hypothetical protein [Streptomyces sp. NPDC088847]|uniref:hypothetical protein n=1 Tax=Streptomyces sp. NPDC088847 TaxID=3365909 RepID=UPI0037F19775